MKRVAQSVASELKARAVDSLLDAEYPITYHKEQDDELLTVCIDILENTESYLKMGVSVSDGRFPSAYLPVSLSLVLER